jgi:hypothetical protein
MWGSEAERADRAKRLRDFCLATGFAKAGTALVRPLRQRG